MNLTSFVSFNLHRNIILQSILLLFQVNVLRKTVLVPIELAPDLSPFVFNQIQAMEIRREIFTIFKKLFIDIILQTFEIRLGFLAIGWKYSEMLAKIFKANPKDEVIVTSIFITLFNIYVSIRSVPDISYTTFTRSDPPGCNRITRRNYLFLTIKMFFTNLVSYLIVGMLLVTFALHLGTYFYLALWALAVFIFYAAILMFVYVIAPFGNVFKPLEDGPLRVELKKITEKVGFPIENVYTSTGNSDPRLNNAYFLGLIITKRIIISESFIQEDTEQRKCCKIPEIVAIVAHELAHWKHRDNIKKNIIFQLNYLIIFVIFGQIYQYDITYLFFPPGVRPAFVVFFITYYYILALYHTLYQLCNVALSRHMEYKADKFTVELGLGDDLIRALIKILLERQVKPISDPLYQFWFFTHPTILERVRRVREHVAMLDLAGERS